MQRQHIAVFEQRLAAFGDIKTVRTRGGLRMLPSPDQHFHAERLAVTGEQLPDFPVAPDPERLAAKHLAQAKIRRQRGGFQTRLLPRALLQVRDVLRNPALRGHDQRPRQLGRRDRRTGTFEHGNSAFGTGFELNMAARFAGLADHAQPGQFIEQLGADPGALADQNQGFDFRESASQLSEAAHRVIEYFHLVIGEKTEAIELANGVLIVVQDGNFDWHGLAFDRHQTCCRNSKMDRDRRAKFG